jgi:hypothetical protein
MYINTTSSKTTRVFKGEDQSCDTKPAVHDYSLANKTTVTEQEDQTDENCWINNETQRGSVRSRGFLKRCDSDELRWGELGGIGNTSEQRG